MNPLLSTFVFLIGFCAINSFCQIPDNELSPGYYVVVGAYAETKEAIAIIYVNKLKEEGYNAKHGFNSSKGLYFVYLKYFDNLSDAVQDMLKTRKNNQFSDAWVRVVPGDIRRNPSREGESLSESTGVVANNEKGPKSTRKNVGVKDDGVQSASNRLSQGDSTMLEKEPLDSVATIEGDISTDRSGAMLKNTKVFLSLYNARNNRILDGEVKVIDTDKARLMEEVKGNEYIALPDPNNETGTISLIAEVFGYRKVQHEFNYYKPIEDTVKSYVDFIESNFVVHFDMVRYRRGDIVTLYNVYFYNDAALMLPESKYELNSLLQMLVENRSYKIRLHGHTNGNYTGKIISSGDRKNFFSLTNDSKTSIGSAKRLSELRAQVIKDYLIEEGIEGSRVEIKAWGGKRPIYNKHGVNAKKNVRVEVEILED